MDTPSKIRMIFVSVIAKELNLTTEQKDILSKRARLHFIAYATAMEELKKEQETNY